MQTKYEYISFTEKEKKPKTFVYSCTNNKSGFELGVIKWHGPWRQYCYFPTVKAVYSCGCFEDITDFLHQINKK